MLLLGKKRKTVLLVEPEGYEGVRRIAGKVAGDIYDVTGALPELTDALPKEDTQVILCASIGSSPLCDRLMMEGALDLSRLRGKRECFQISYATLDGRQMLVIFGSDKRGAIYGMFTLSEYLGVSPLKDFGDVKPRFLGDTVIGRDIERISKEPSVKYRGFFINDEWPCFGTWATKHFGDVNAQCYERIFELLLRLKGNYLWPAMWNSSFPLDGPGSKNEELADLYGVIMGYSHHEPCLRASEEWDKVRGLDSPYGNAWSFDANEQGLVRYWADALRRSGRYENTITIGMRGERDSAILGREATLSDNIELLRRVIVKQRELIRELVPGKPVQMLALYKEVERYFYGDENTPGLKGWQELDDVLFLLCEDNFGHLRTVPPRDMKNHPGGWGMYYHFDYHGGPISYEWVDSTPLSQTWEQMTQAWEYGIRELWVVNVGDLKFHEVPLSYFLSLAYDFDRWGTGHPESPREYLDQWSRFHFPQSEQPEQIGRLFEDYVNLNSLRRPEALHAGIYHPCHHRETDRMLALAEELEQRAEKCMERLCPQERDAYYSMIGYPLTASVNLLRLHLYAGKNHHYAAQGKPVANRYFALSEDCIRRDRELITEWAGFLNGKWDGMQLAAHIGFTKWNEDDSRYPVLMHIIPMAGPALKVSRADEEAVATKNYGAPTVISVPDFLDAGCDRVSLEIANSGSGSLSFTVQPEGTLPDWLTVAPASGTVTDQVELTLICHREKLPMEPEHCRLLISDGNAAVAVAVSGRADRELSPGVFAPKKGVVAMPASGYLEKRDTDGAAFYRIDGFGKYGSGMKVTPSTAQFRPEDDKPGLRYAFYIEEAGEYTVEFLTAPNNPVEIGSEVRLLAECGGEKEIVTLIPKDFRAGENDEPRWCAAVLDQIRRSSAHFQLPEGVAELNVYPLEPGVVLERIIVHKKNHVLPVSYLGPEDSKRKEQNV